MYNVQLNNSYFTDGLQPIPRYSKDNSAAAILELSKWHWWCNVDTKNTSTQYTANAFHKASIYTMVSELTDIQLKANHSSKFL